MQHIKVCISINRLFNDLHASIHTGKIATGFTKVWTNVEKELTGKINWVINHSTSYRLAISM